MSILAECPYCHKKQSNRNKKCPCGANLDKEKKNKKVNYWINYRVGKTQRREKIGTSLTEALAADGKRKAQKFENPSILEKVADKNISFQKLTEWYFELPSVKALAYYKDLKNNLNSFNSKFGEMLIHSLKPEDLKTYQKEGKEQGFSDSYIDKHIGAARTMVKRAFDNDKIHGDALKPFNKVKRLLKNSRANARKRILSHDEFYLIMKNLPSHLKPIFATGYYTGMRLDEILSLSWEKVDLKGDFIYLEAPDTKDNEDRSIPIPGVLREILVNIPKGLHDKHVFLYRGKPIKDIRTGLKKACEKSKIAYGQKVKNGFVFHDLRHTFNTNMRKAGVPESVIMEITGHVTREMFDRYNTVDEGDMSKAIGDLDVFLKNTIQSVTKNAEKL
ncbi:tyrosine-type recombinase/integrase [Desulfobacter curvatus]|uniref:tyrosine-type recombinase/integrase n=1 Tax=Desulfobacter curvatus TaxID=2290 RepID=UPI00036DDC0B|nr:site-specific integrase [Desulfobacter curvatus]